MKVLPRSSSVFVMILLLFTTSAPFISNNTAIIDSGGMDTTINQSQHISSSYDVQLSELDLIKVDLSIYAETDFVSTWQPDLTGDGPSNTIQISLPLESSGTYNFTVNWGDGTSDTITSWNQSETTHTYSSSGRYIVTISGTFNGWNFANSDDRHKLLDISQWGNLSLGNSGRYFGGAENLVISATDTPDLSGTTNLDYAFLGATSLGTSGNLNSWNVSQVTDMSWMFNGAINFDQSLDSWNVSNVTDMSRMFYGAGRFNHSLDSWDVSSVTDMNHMFFDASSFNQPLNSWDVSNVTDMSRMFHLASSFNQSLNSWDVSQVTDMSRMFQEAENFNQPLDTWDVSQVTDMDTMFAGASNFNQSLNSWDVSGVTDMSWMFNAATSFNQPLDTWDISSVADMSYLFTSTPLSTENYDDTLISWSQLNVESDVTLDAGDVEYSDAAQSARNTLIETYDWTINDGGLNSSSPADDPVQDDPQEDEPVQKEDPQEDEPVATVGSSILLMLSSIALVTAVIAKRRL